jgi:hypothetical protein
MAIILQAIFTKRRLKSHDHSGLMECPEKKFHVNVNHVGEKKQPASM